MNRLYNFIVSILKELTTNTDYYINLLIEHLKISLFSMIISIILGIGIGVIIFYNKKSRSFILGITNGIYTIPSIAVLGLFIPLVGIGFWNASITLIIYGLLPIIRNTYTGLENIDPKIIEVSQGMGATEFQTFKKIRLPLAMPIIISGIRTLVIMTISLAGIASFIGAGGLGQAIYRGINTNNPILIIIGSLSIAALAIFLDYLLNIFEKRSFQKINGNSASYKKINLLQNKKSILLFGIAIFGIFIFTFTKNNNKIKADPNKKIVIATKPSAEQLILGEILSLLIQENTDITVEKKFSIGGGTSNIHPALIKGEVDIYPEYTGTSWLFVLKQKQALESKEMYEKIKKEYEEKYKLEWLGLLGFNNTFSLSMKEELANKYNIKTFSDLAKLSEQFRFGAEFDFFEREDGFPGLKKLYGFNFKKLTELDINLKYKAIGSGEVEVINSFSTDSLIKKYNMVTLKDDKNFFPSYDAGFVARKEILDKYPELIPLINKLNGQINDNTMINLNYQVEVENKNPEDVARKFLEEKGLI
ncbi:MAG: ABC transporter permease/substrate-binding protein [Sebaldella sp.]|nr:ABC transporter permease/substrate-binding protein [Sebaldella sp.]